MQTKEKINSEKCFSKKLNLLRQPILSYIKSRVFNFQDAEDLTQNVLHIICAKENEIDPTKNFFGWSMVIANFQIKGYLTRKKRDRLVFAIEGNKIGADKDFIAELCDNPRSILSSKEKNSVFEQVKSSFNKKECQVFELCAQGLNPNEIMKDLKITRSHYSVSKSRALSKAKKIFKDKSIKEYQL